MINRFSPRSLFSLLALSVAGLSGCTTSTQFVDYQEQRLYSGANAGGMDYVEIGPATASSAGYVWDDCDSLQQEALQALRDEADQHGANTIFDVRWVNHADGTLDDTPLCTTRWGWFVGFGVAGLGPWVKVTEVRGKLAYMDAPARDELSAAADQYKSELQEQNQQKNEGQALDTDRSDSGMAGEEEMEAAAVADEAPASEEAGAADAESSAEARNTEAAEASDESEVEADAEPETGAESSSF